jgi:hypothetical protein
VVDDSGRAIGVYFRELLAWQPRTRAVQVTEPATASEAFEQWFGASEPATGSSQQAQAESPAEGEEDDDDDLEMFRSWLQSLKK